MIPGGLAHEAAEIAAPCRSRNEARSLMGELGGA